ncbi:MAG: phage virion morphogenesis protein [Bacteroidetes bacterium]|nr:phage virion morphogenesis protein [Bacteroidota bacterium]
MTKQKYYKQLIKNSQRKISGSLLIKKILSSDKLNITDEKLENFYFAHKDDFKLFNYATLFNRISFNEKDKNTLTEVINKESQNIITIGSQLIYANIHEYGGQAGRNLATTIPARPYLNPAIKEFEEKELKISQGQR